MPPPRVLRTLRESRAFAVSILAQDQQHIADRFAGRCGAHGNARYAGARWSTLVTGSALLDGALAGLDCSLENITEWHTHAIVIGRVEAVRAPAGGDPLIYSRGQYATLAPQPGAPSREKR